MKTFLVLFGFMAFAVVCTQQAFAHEDHHVTIRRYVSGEQLWWCWREHAGQGVHLVRLVGGSFAIEVPQGSEAEMVISGLPATSYLPPGVHIVTARVAVKVRGRPAPKVPDKVLDSRRDGGLVPDSVTR